MASLYADASAECLDVYVCALMRKEASRNHESNLSIHGESDAPTRRHAESDYLVDWETLLPLEKVAVCFCHNISMRKSGPTRA